jgi:hypothetical protein
VLIDLVQILDRQITPVASVNQWIEPGKEAEAINATRLLRYIHGLCVPVTGFRKGFEDQ